MTRFAVGAAALTFVLLAGTAQAQETGVAEIHEWVKVGRKTCMLDHFHYGSGTGRSRSEAQRAAILSWREFTAWEYGDPWGSYRIAASRKMACSRASRSWSCSLEARPCRPY